MYGVLHKGLFSWIRTLPDGEDTLSTILEIVGKSHIDDFFRYYDQTVTHQLLDAIQEVMGVPLDECKYQAGLQFMVGIGETGFQATIHALGRDLFSVLDNIDSLHESMRPSFPQMKSPSIRPEKIGDNMMAVHYYSENSDLASFFMGAIKACAKAMFNIDVDVTHRIKKGKGSNHDVFHVFSDSNIFPEEEEKTNDHAVKYATLALPDTITDKLLPFHFAINRSNEIVSIGSELKVRLKHKDIEGQRGSTVFKLIRPLYTRLTYDDMMQHLDDVFVIVVSSKALTKPSKNIVLTADLDDAYDHLKSTGTGRKPSDAMSMASSVASSVFSLSNGDVLEKTSRLVSKSSNLKMHGQVVYDAGTDCLIFAGCPVLRSLEDMNSVGVSLKDMPIHSHGKELLYSSLLQSASALNANKVDAKMAQLDETMVQVNQKSEQVDQLLSSILPQSVAESLAKGHNPPPEHYPNVSLLYSDIAGFTNISSNLPPSEVVDMLHTLFLKFDDLVEKHGCYKVETIGDAYVVSAGCPEECPDHALRLANFAIDMLHTVATVKSPVDGEALRIRVGLHSGPAMAGVVGRVRPRYCLFGDIVTFAEAMESNGIPCCIQASFRFLESLPFNHPLQIVPRGHIPIKNKGHMKTFLILGNSELDYPPLLPTPAHVDDIGPHLMEMSRLRSDTSADRIAAIQTARTRRKRNDALV